MSLVNVPIVPSTCAPAMTLAAENRPSVNTINIVCQKLLRLFVCRQCGQSRTLKSPVLKIIGAEGPPYTDRRGRVCVLYQI